MVELDQALEEWLKTVQEIGDLSLAEQSKITQAGADVFKDELAKATKEKHYSNHKDPKYGHMADSLSVQKNGRGWHEKRQSNRWLEKSFSCSKC
jgi:hypothetical protein